MTIGSVASPVSASARRCSPGRSRSRCWRWPASPGTVGFIGKFQLIHALVDGGYGWLAIVLVVGAMISLGYYLRVVAAVWMTPDHAHSLPAPGAYAPIAGGSPEADKLPYPEIVARRPLVFGASRSSSA